MPGRNEELERERREAKTANLVRPAAAAAAGSNQIIISGTRRIHVRVAFNGRREREREDAYARATPALRA